MDLNSLLKTAKEAVIAAGEKILEIYASGDFSIEVKADHSPLTLADKAAHLEISKFLSPLNIPVLSEEGRNIPFAERSEWEYFWMVDPLDGTKEFIKKNGEFTVNIALIKNGIPILGVVYPPVLQELYWAVVGEGAFISSGSKVHRLKTSGYSLGSKGLRVVASRSHMSPETQQFVDSLDEPRIVSRGSSLKFLLVASAQADIYPRFAPTMEWDTAAAHIIVSESGGAVVLDNLTTPLSYNKENLLNPYFIVLPTNKMNQECH